MRQLIAVICTISACLAAPAVAQSTSTTPTVWLEDLNIANIQQEWGQPQARQSVTGSPLNIGGTRFDHGVGSHASGKIVVDLHGGATRFTCQVGVDSDTNGKGSVTFAFQVDGRTVEQTGIFRGGQPARSVDIDLTGAHRLTILIGDAGDGIDNDHADLADAQFALAGPASPRPEIIGSAVDPGRLIIPADNPVPAIHGPRIVGATPGYPFLFRVPATGKAPLTFRATHVPPGLQLDPETGIITGSLKSTGTWAVSVSVRGPMGQDRREITIVGGSHKLALTPPMGWNSWNVWQGSVDTGKVIAAADAMVTSGLAAYGYQYVNIDDTWEAPQRDANGNISGNDKFPDMKAIAEYIHMKGLKFGIYSSPGPQTCAGYVGSYGHEQQDARTYASWGVDYPKYDWCSYGQLAPKPTLVDLQKPYRVMRAALDNVPRDIVFSLCQYGWGDVWNWGAAVGGNLWRTHDDISDRWSSLADIYSKENGHSTLAQPGHWNDPDMLMVGVVGLNSPHVHPSRLTPNEQILHITMWSMDAAPLLAGCVLTDLDPFTKALLTNEEMIDVDQDPLGNAATRRAVVGDGEVWARPLADGSTAVALVNPGDDDPLKITFHLRDVGLSTPQMGRDLWLHKSVGIITSGYTVDVPSHGVVALRLAPLGNRSPAKG